VTAVTTAGLLAGLFGSAFVPAAYAVTPGVSLIASRLDVDGFLDIDGSNAENQTAAGDGLGTATYPWYIVAPLSNDGLGTATSMADDDLADGTTDGSRIELELALADLDTAAGVQIAEPTAAVTVTGDLLFFCEDAASITAALGANAPEDDFTKFKTASQTYSDSDVDTGLACQINASDDDAYGSGTVTVKIEDTTVATYHIDVLGAGKTIEIGARRGAYVAIDGAAAAAFMSMYVEDAAGTDLGTYIEDGDKIEDYFNSDTNAEFWFSVDGDEDSTLVAENNTYVGLYADLAATACPATATPGSTISVYAYADEDVAGDTEYSTGEIKSNAVTQTCTGDGALAEITGFTVADSTVDQGDYVAITVTVEDGYGNPMGVGGDARDLDLTNVATTRGLVNVGFSLAPIEYTPAATTADVNGAGLFEDVIAAAGWTSSHTCTSADVDAVDADTDVAGTGGMTWDGKFVLCYKASTVGTGGYSVTLTPSVANVGATTTTIKASFTVARASGGSAATSSTIAASVNAAKRIATFTLSAAASKLVTITVERVSDGKVWTYYRKANASGVATFLIRKVGRFDVFASYGDDVTETVRMRRR